MLEILNDEELVTDRDRWKEVEVAAKNYTKPKNKQKFALQVKMAIEI